MLFSLWISEWTDVNSPQVKEKAQERFDKLCDDADKGLKRLLSAKHPQFDFDSPPEDPKDLPEDKWTADQKLYYLVYSRKYYYSKRIASPLFTSVLKPIHERAGYLKQLEKEGLTEEQAEEELKKIREEQEVQKQKKKAGNKKQRVDSGSPAGTSGSGTAEQRRLVRKLKDELKTAEAELEDQKAGAKGLEEEVLALKQKVADQGMRIGELTLEKARLNVRCQQVNMYATTLQGMMAAINAGRNENEKIPVPPNPFLDQGGSPAGSGMMFEGSPDGGRFSRNSNVDS